MDKRLKKEINIHINSNYTDTKKMIWLRQPRYSIYSRHDENNIFFYSLIDNMVCEIKISIDNNYPFAPPYSIYIKDIPYKNIMTTISNNILKEYEQYIGHDIKHLKCCCNSISSNWLPLYGFSNILDELNSKLLLYKKITNMIHAKKIMVQRLGFVIPSMFTFF
jgi:ubiquitin-protein ligase